MSSNQTFGLAAAAMLGVACQAGASVQLSLDFSDGANSVTGQFMADALAGGDYHATSGTLDVVASNNQNLVGIYSLVSGGPGIATSPSGSFLYNNILYPTTSPYVDYYGLLAASAASGVEINLWSDNGDYELWASQGTQKWILEDSFPNSGSATATITVVPEASTTISGTALLLLSLCVITIRTLRSRCGALQLRTPIYGLSLRIHAEQKGTNPGDVLNGRGLAIAYRP